MRSEVKQAALQKVCSSLTPRLQTNSGQDEERGRGKGGERARAHTRGLRSVETDRNWLMLACTVTELGDDLCMAESWQGKESAA